MKLSKEQQVQAIYDLKVGYTLGHADIAILKSMARQLLASIEQEPVLIVGDDGGDALAYRRLIQNFAPGTKLYAEPRLPQPAVVPDAIEIDDDFDSAFEHGKAVGWNLYRAAMLQGAEPASQPYTLRDGWVAVPVDPTAEMQSAAAGAIRLDTTPINKLWTGNAVYKAMLAAAPQQEVNK